MTVVSSQVFAENPLYYLNLANTENVAIKSEKKTYWLMSEPEDYENPSPSGDPYWDDPRNLEELKRRIQLRDEGKTNLTRMTPELRKELLGL